MKAGFIICNIKSYTSILQLVSTKLPHFPCMKTNLWLLPAENEPPVKDVTNCAGSSPVCRDLLDCDPLIPLGRVNVSALCP